MLAENRLCYVAGMDGGRCQTCLEATALHGELRCDHSPAWFTEINQLLVLPIFNQGKFPAGTGQLAWTVLLSTQRKLPGRKEATYTHSALVWRFPNTRLIIPRFLIFKVFLEIGCFGVFLPLFNLPSCPGACSFAGDNSLNDWGYLKKAPCASELPLSHSEAPRHKQSWRALSQLHLRWWCFCWNVCKASPFLPSVKE